MQNPVDGENSQSQDRLVLELREVEAFIKPYWNLFGDVVSGVKTIKRKLTSKPDLLDDFANGVTHRLMDTLLASTMKTGSEKWKFSPLVAQDVLADVNAEIEKRLQKFVSPPAARKITRLTTIIFRMQRAETEGAAMRKQRREDLYSCLEIVGDKKLFDAPQARRVRKSMMREAQPFLRALDRLDELDALKLGSAIRVREDSVLVNFQDAQEIERAARKWSIRFAASVQTARESKWIWLANTLLPWTLAFVSWAAWIYNWALP